MTSVVGTLRRAVAAACALLLARAEFAAAELAQAGANALGWFLTALLAGALMVLALVTLSATVVMALWDRFGWYSLGVLAVLYAGAACALLLRVLRQIRASPRLLSQTFDELAKDREVLFGSRRGS